MYRSTGSIYNHRCHKGGQNVNKVETKVELVFNIDDSMTLLDAAKAILKKKLVNRIDNESNIRIVSQTERTQLGNRKKAIEKFVKMINNALKKEKIRVKTVKSLSTKINILEQKRILGLKKKHRSEKDFDDE
jgi:ribosome-associated protein